MRVSPDFRLNVHAWKVIENLLETCQPMDDMVPTSKSWITGTA